MYLCAVMDVHARMVVGWSVRARQDRQPVIQAVLMALWPCTNRTPVILHSDRGTRFTGDKYQQFLKGHNLIGPMSDAGESRSRTGLEFCRRNTWAGPIRAEFAGERIETDDGQPEHIIGLQVRLQLGRSSSPLLVERGNQRTKSR